ncbi:MAG TPA: metalloregulator ArsR/SmtB family transcription factor [Armatimonadota bacterium]
MRLRRLKLNSVDAVEVFKALASETRVAILRALAEAPRNVSALSEMMGISQSATTKHIQQLQAAGLIQFEHLPGAQGTQKLCSLRYEMLNLFFNSKNLPRMGAGDLQHGPAGTVEVAGIRWLPEEAEGRIHAMDVDSPASQVLFINNSDTPYERFWLNLEGKRESYGLVMPGSVVSQATWAKHAWLLTSPDETVLGVFVVKEPVGCIVIGKPRKPVLAGPTEPVNGSGQMLGAGPERIAAGTDHECASRDGASGKARAASPKTPPVGVPTA